MNITKIEIDEGYYFGRGAFETVKVVNKKPLFLDRHLIRLRDSLKFFEIDLKIKEEDIFEFIENYEEDNFALKIICSDKNLIFKGRKDPYINNYNLLKLKLSKIIKSSRSILVYHKSLSYYENIHEHRHAQKTGFDSALFVNEKGEITESSYANIFFVKTGKIFTPHLSSGLLKGTMRDYILEKYRVEECSIKSNEIKNFDEAFLSNSLMGVRAVESIDNYLFSKNNIYLSILEDIKKIGF